MKKSVGILSVLALAASMAFVAPVRAQDADNAPQSQPAQRGHMRRARGEAHPVIMRAIRQLQNTKMILQKDGAHDFDGHRVQAIKEIDEAMNQLKQALQADKN